VQLCTARSYCTAQVAQRRSPLGADLTRRATSRLLSERAMPTPTTSDLATASGRTSVDRVPGRDPI